MAAAAQPAEYEEDIYPAFWRLDKWRWR